MNQITGLFTLTLLRTVLLAISLLGSTRLAQAQMVEELFAIEGFDPGGLVRLDKRTGSVLEVHRAFAGLYLWHGLMFDGAKFIAPGVGPQYQLILTELGPSSGYQGAPLLDVGYAVNLSLDRDPTTGRVWGVGQIPNGGGATRLLEFDTVTGASVNHGTLIGPTFATTGIAFDAAGRCYVTADLGPVVWRLDLQSRVATPLGNLQMGNGLFWDITVSLSGEIWGSFDSTSSTALPPGIYRFDLQAFTPTLVRQTTSHLGTWAYGGLAFARYPAPSNTCTGKLNSQDCTPAIEVEGFPSASGNKGFLVRAKNVINRQPGVLLFSVNGAASTPFGGGTLCLSAPWHAGPVRLSGGTSSGVDCSGTWELDFQTEIHHRTFAGLPPQFSGGQIVHLQWFGRDPYTVGSDPIALSGAVAVTMMP